MTHVIEVKSHVARDLMQSAQVFNTPARVAWEYVSNSLDNPEPGQASVVCRVEVSPAKKRLRVIDNARGMTRADLQNFFTMHAENVRRKAGLAARGRFGTGKSAAFGIARRLHIRTVRDGRANEVELRRDQIEAAREGEPFPVQELAKDVAVNEPNGTVVTIDEIQLPIGKIEPGAIKVYIERHFGRHQQSHIVYVNNEPCRYQEPDYADERFFDVPDELAPVLGDGIRARICFSPTPLEDSAGVDVLSKGIYHATTLAGSAGREFSSHIFGDVDVARLEDVQDTEVPPPFDNTRRNELNPLNRTVGILFGWLQACIETVRTDWVRKDQERRRTEEAKRLRREAEEIAKILNDDFREYQEELARAKRSAGGDLGPLKALKGDPGPGEVLPDEGTEPSAYEAAHGPREGDGPDSDGEKLGDIPGGGPGLAPGASTGSEQRTTSGPQPRPRGGFSLDFRNEGERVYRSRYESEQRLIVVNLDHPQVASAVTNKGSVTSPEFRKLAYEIAFTEYAVAVAREQATRQGEAYDAIDALTDVRSVIDRVTRRAAAIFGSSATA
ncbi:MAG TPA: ATP-binding protein [Vicinamibacterales bacterium]|nr:ATP-binding protein [Vicinamibacterales bacterium]